MISSFLSTRRRTSTTVHPKRIHSAMASPDHHIALESKVHLRIHAWCEKIYIRGVPSQSAHEPLIIDIPHTWESCIRSKRQLKNFRFLALQTIMASEWGQPFHLPGARFQTKKVTIEYQTTQNGDTHVNLDLVNCRNNPSPRITTYGNIKTIHLWIRLTVIRIESWHKIIYPSQQRAAVRSKKRARQARATEGKEATDLTRPVPITLSPIQMLSISAFLKANEFATRLPLV